jgi:hypothetical protein
VVAVYPFDAGSLVGDVDQVYSEVGALGGVGEPSCEGVLVGGGVLSEEFAAVALAVGQITPIDHVADAFAA